MRKLNFILLLIFGTILFACNEENIDEAFLLDNQVRMESSGTEIFRFNSITCQEFFNADNCSYSVGTDTMSDFFAAKFNTLPVQEGQTIYGSIKWTTPTSISTKENVALSVVKLEGDRIWLWSSTSRIGMVVRFLD